MCAWHLKVYIFQIFHFEGVLLKEKFIRIFPVIYIANNLLEIYEIRHEKYDVIKWYLKGCSSRTIGFQDMVLLQILISIKFPFQLYKIRLALQVKNFTSINCSLRQLHEILAKIVASSKFQIKILKETTIPSYTLLTQFGVLWNFLSTHPPLYEGHQKDIYLCS